MKKLNRKGFTLIELLAVIVILAIILVVTVPNIINSISDARVSSIHNLAVSAANTYDTIAAQDLIATDKVLDDVTITVNTGWQCIPTDLAEILGLPENDVTLTGTKPADDLDDITANTCSAIKLNTNGSAEILLVASDNGKFAISGNTVYALSTDSTGNKIAVSGS